MGFVKERQRLWQSIVESGEGDYDALIWNAMVEAEEYELQRTYELQQKLEQQKEQQKQQQAACPLSSVAVSPTTTA